MSALWILAALLAAGLLLLAVPFDLEFRLARYSGKTRLEVRLGWLFGLVRMPIRQPGAAGKDKKPKPKPKRRAARSHGLTLLKEPGMARRLTAFVRDLLGCLHVRSLRLEGRLGLDDPADTGMLWGFVGPLLAVLQSLPGTRVAVDPDFTGAALELEGQGALRIVLLELLWTLLRFLLAPVTLRALYRTATVRP